MTIKAGVRVWGRRTHRARVLRNEEGATLVETALACAIFFSLLLGIIELSFALYSYTYVCDAAREGARYAMVRGSASCTNTPGLTNCNATATQIRSYVRGLGYPGINGSQLTVTTTWLRASTTIPVSWQDCESGTCNAPQNLVKVSVSYPAPVQIPFWSGKKINVSSTSQMVVSQ